MKEYIVKKWDHLEKIPVNNFSQDQISEHLKLYAGYVHNLNLLQEKIYNFSKKNTQTTLEYNEIKRRFGWEFNGVRLHEYYFENLGSHESLNPNSQFAQKLQTHFSSIDRFMEDFQKTGLIRGIGWVILYYDPFNDNLFNVWIDDHDEGHGSLLQPLLVMDVWEHAYCVDWKPTERAHYIESFAQSIRWTTVEKRWEAAQKYKQ